MYEIIGIGMIVIAFGMLIYLGYFLSNPPKDIK